MEFDKISNLNNNIYLPSKKSEVKKPASNLKEYKAPDNNTPVDPKYWQSVTFKGINKPEKTPEIIKQEGENYLEDAIKELKSNLWNEPSEVYEKHISKLKELTFLGKNAMKLYIQFAIESARLYNSDHEKNFDIIADDFFSNYQELKEDEIRPFLNLARVISRPAGGDFSKRREFFNFLMTDKNHSIKNKIEWFNYISSEDIFSKSEKENIDSLDKFIRYISFPETKEEKNEFLGMQIPAETFSKLVELLDSGLMSKEAYLSCIKDITCFSKEKKEDFSHLISNLYKKAIDEGDKSTSSYFENLYSKNLVRKITLRTADDLITENDSHKKEVSEYFAQTGKEKGSFLFNDEKDLTAALNAISKDNFEDFKTIIEKENKSPSFSMYKFIEDNKNPKTNLFDKNIYAAICDFNQKANDRGGYNSWFYGSSSEVIKAACDMKTGELDKNALDFIDKYYFQIEKTNKLKTAAKSVINNFHYKPTPFYKYPYNDIEGKLVEILNCMKDKEGSFNAKNIEAMSVFLEMPVSNISDFSFFDYMKDENGVVDKTKFKFAKEVFNKTKESKAVTEVLEVFSTLGNDEALMAFNSLSEILKTEDSAYSNLKPFVDYCFGDGAEKVENAIFVKDLADSIDGEIFLNDNLFEAISNPLNKELILEFVKMPEFNGYRVNGLVALIKDYSDERGTISDFMKEKIKSFAKINISFYNFSKLYDACIVDKENPEASFKNEQFDKIVNLYSINPSICYEIEPKILIDIAEDNFQPSALKFKEKVSLLNVFMKLKELPDKSGFDEEFINKTITDLDRSLNDESIYLPVDDKVKNTFLKNVLATHKNSENFSKFEQTLVNSIPLLENMESGVALSFSRENFLKELTELCDDEEKIKILKEKTGIMPIIEENDNKKEIKGYNGIILLDKLNKEDPFENKLYNLIHRFMYDNEVLTPSFELNEELNKIIKACPEFINIIGKKQHGTHKYTLDVHSLLVLAYSLNNSAYQKLNPVDKMMLKVSALFHDIAKAENTVDNGHQEPSSIYARSIVKKFFTNEDTRDRVYELIRNHHWLAEFANSSNKEQCAKETAYKFRRYNDFEIAKIMAKSDLMAVSPEFYKDHKGALNELQPIEDELNNFYGTGCAVFSDIPVNTRMLQNHIQTKDGRKYQVINFHEIKNDEDLMQYGFEIGKTKDNLNFLVHMVDEDKMESDLRTVDMLTSSVNGGVLSESIISPNYNRTYCNRKYGVLLSQINANVVNMNSFNQGSGYEKDFNDIIRLAFNDDVNSARRNFKKGFLEALNINPETVSNDEFAEFYKNNIVSKTMYSQFVKNKEYKLGKYSFFGTQIVDAIRKYQDSIIDKTQKEHNEIVGYIPKIKGVIAKSKTLNEVPDELLDFAYKNNLPVILI